MIGRGLSPGAGVSPRSVVADAARLRDLQHLFLTAGVPLFWWTDVPYETADPSLFVATQLVGISGIMSSSDSLAFSASKDLSPEERASIDQVVKKVLPWPSTTMLRGEAALLCSFGIHFALASQATRFGYPVGDQAPETVSLRHGRITRWQVPAPKPLPTPPSFWSRLDRSAVARVKLTPADEQIVVLAARQGNGGTSPAPHILRVELTPGIVREHTIMHVRVLTSPDANGVYFRFLIWEIGVPPVGAFHLPAGDPDYPNRAYEEFERTYDVPAIPRIFRGKTYTVEVIATGRFGIASGAFVPVKVQ